MTEQLQAVESPYPIIAIGGLLTIKQLSGFYEPLLKNDPATDLPAKERFIAPHMRGLCPVGEMREQLNIRLDDLYDRLDSKMFVVGHSLGGLMATLAAIERPDRVAGVVSLGGVHSGYEETPAAFALRHLLGNPATSKLLEHDSDFMHEHRYNMATQWPEGVDLHIIATKLDQLIKPRHSFNVTLPNNHSLHKRQIVWPQFNPKQPWRVFPELPADVDRLVSVPTEHIGIAVNPSVIRYVKQQQYNQQSADLLTVIDNIEPPILLPAAA